MVRMWRQVGRHMEVMAFAGRLGQVPHNSIPSFITTTVPRFCRTVNYPGSIVLSIRTDVTRCSAPGGGIPIRRCRTFRIALAGGNTFITIRSVIGSRTVVRTFGPCGASKGKTCPFIPTRIVRRLCLRLGGWSRGPSRSRLYNV